jgi:hypothetical protein
MKTFKDTQGRQWNISINLGTAMAIKDSLGIDLLQPEAGDPPLLTRIGTDEILLGQILCGLLEDQFEKHNLTAKDVRMSFDGDTLLAAQKAFYEEMVDFFLARGRTDRSKAVAAQMKLIDKAITAIENKVDEIDIDALVDGQLSGNLQEH